MTLAASLFGGVAYAQDPSEPTPEPTPEVTAETTPEVKAETTPEVTAEPTTELKAEEKADNSPFKISGFIDGYMGYLSSEAGQALPGHQAYVRNNGFSLAFVGLDLVYDTEYVSTTMNLRFGPGVNAFYGAGYFNAGNVTAPVAGVYSNDSVSAAMQNVTQAFVTLKANDALTVDFGQFSTIYGAEVAESFNNFNYSRGALYYSFQPFWHTGARFNYKVSDQMTIKAMAVNGVNTFVDTGDSIPQIGLQGVYTSENFSLYLGYLGTLEKKVDGPWDHLVDVVASTSLGGLDLLFNFDFAMDDGGANAGNKFNFWGGSLAARKALSDSFKASFRVEYLKDEDAVVLLAKSLLTNTLTFDWLPLPTPNALIRLDLRFEKSTDGDIFAKRGDTAATDSAFAAVVGVVVKTN